MASNTQEATRATLERATRTAGRGTINTVLLCTTAVLNQLVLDYDFDAAEEIKDPIWKVKINVRHIKQTAAHGASGAILTGPGTVETGDVTLKVFFDEASLCLSVTGVAE